MHSAAPADGAARLKATCAESHAGLDQAGVTSTQGLEGKNRKEHSSLSKDSALPRHQKFSRKQCHHSRRSPKTRLQDVAHIGLLGSAGPAGSAGLTQKQSTQTWPSIDTEGGNDAGSAAWHSQPVLNPHCLVLCTAGVRSVLPQAALLWLLQALFLQLANSASQVLGIIHPSMPADHELILRRTI